MVLPPELIDEILFYLRHDKLTLLKCSLVAKSWAYRSQKLLFNWHLHFTGGKTFRMWRETASQTNFESLEYVRSITCSEFDSLDDFHGDHLKSFHRLQHITLHLVVSTRSDLANSLPASQNTLSSLHLSDVTLYNTAIVNLINHFPNLSQLHIDHCTFRWHGWDAPSPSRSPSGKLRLTGLGVEDMKALFSCLSNLELEYDELEFVDFPSAFLRDSVYVPSIVYACGHALARLELCSFTSLSHLTLENCSGLRELVFTAKPMGPEPGELSLIYSIASTNMQKIVFVPYYGGDGWEPVKWSSLEMVLCGVANRLRALGSKHILELEFQVEPKFAGIYAILGIDMIFPHFRQKGRVSLSDPVSGRRFHCSGR